MEKSSPNTARFRLIEGGGKTRSPWLTPPTTVLGRSPFDKDAILAYRLAAGDLQKYVQSGRRQPILDLWSNVIGDVPPVPGSDRFNALVGRTSTAGLRSSHACFRGIMRPTGDDDRGFDYVAFISKPLWSFQYQPSMACVIQPFEVPQDLVFVIYARLDFPEGRAYQSRTGTFTATNAVVTHWHFVEADTQCPTLPVDYKTRFRKSSGSPRENLAEQEMIATYRAKAIYYEDADALEYIREDATAVYRRIDRFLTLIIDMRTRKPIGFKIKGFKNIFLRTIKPNVAGSEIQFLRLVSILEKLMTEIGDAKFLDSDAADAYAIATSIATEDQVLLSDFPNAA